MTVANVALSSRRPIRDGLLQFDPPRLLGSHCKACDTRTFPPRDFCPACLRDGPHDVVPLAASGTVFSYTVVHQAPGGRRTPYVLAYIDLDDAVRVLARIDAPGEQIQVGDKVHLVLQEVGESEGVSLVGYAFVPSALKSGVV